MGDRARRPRAIDHHDLLAQGRAAAPDGIDWVFSPHSQGNEQAFAELLRPFGHIVAIDDPERIALQAFKPKAIAWHWEYMFARPMAGTEEMTEQGRILRRVSELVDRGAVRTTVTETIKGLTADSVRRAHQRVLDGHMVGKVVITR